MGAFLGCVMYGIFLILFFAACYVQWDKHSKGRGVNRVMVFTTVFFGFTITTNCVLLVYRSLRAAFDAPLGETINEYLYPPFPTMEIFRLSLFQFQIVVADIIMAHRMYHIYEKNFNVCIVPLITIAALFAVGCGATNQLRDLSTPHAQKSLGQWTSACFCLTIFNSLFITVAIIFRLWRVHRETARANIRVKGSVILRVMKVLIESAALWTTFVMMNFLAFLAGSNLVSMFLAMTGPAVGISFCLIIVRLGHVLLEPREESWRVSIHTPSTQTPRTGQQPIPFSREVSTNNSKEYPTETESSKEEYVDDPRNSPTVIRASLNLSAPLT